MAEFGTHAGTAGLVTGAASGIGEGIARMFAARGASVTLVDIDLDTGMRIVDDINDAGDTARFSRCDLTDPNQVEQMVSEAVDAYGRLDFAINNAGITGPVAPTADVTLEGWKSVIDLDLSAVFYCMKYELPHMVAAGVGTIVNMSSDAGLQAVPGIAPYVAAKHAVIGLTRAAAIEYATAGVRINAICPGATNTPLMASWFTGDARAEDTAKHSIPLGRIAEVNEVAEGVSWLCSPAASYAVGIALALDGGLTVGVAHPNG